MKSEVVIFGSGGHAKVVYDILLKEGLHTPVAFLSMDKNLKTFLGLPHYHHDELSKLKYDSGIIAIGDNWTRAKLAKIILTENKNFIFVSAIHPSSQLGIGTVIGKGSVVMANVAINPYCQIGEHVIINTSSSVDHDCIVGNFSSIAPGAVLGGNVKVGEFSAISLGANVIHGKKVGNHSVVGAGSLVRNDIEDYVVAYGSPCRVIRKRTEDEKYL
ncbi:MAG: acetyltransferase [Bdellovibrionales bacterium]|nr:acetyltransferase [Bdellovibrionales bacterium]